MPAQRDPRLEPATQTGAVLTEQNAATLVLHIDRARRRLYALLRSHDAHVLSKRPASGKWSILENVRHLIFAEQAHLGQFLPEALAWSLTGLARHGGKTFAVKGGVVVLRLQERQLVPEYAGTEPRGDLEEVLRAWDLIHRPIRKALKARGEDAQYALERHLKHLLRHIEVIEKQLARPSKDP